MMGGEKADVRATVCWQEKNDQFAAGEGQVQGADEDRPTEISEQHP